MKLAQRIRDNVIRSRRTTAEILGVAAELVEGHQQIVRSINYPPLVLPSQPWTILTMKQEFGSFSAAKKHFAKQYGVKANSWKALIDKVNTIESALIHLGY